MFPLSYSRPADRTLEFPEKTRVNRNSRLARGSCTCRGMDIRESIVVRCGRCGRPVRLAFERLRKLRTFDCEQCLAAKRAPGPGRTGEESDADGGPGVLADFTKDLTKREQSILLRKVLGFSDEEIMRAYRVGSDELKELVSLATNIVRRRR